MHFMGLCPARGEQIRSNTLRKSPFCTTTVPMSPLKHASRYNITFSISCSPGTGARVLLIICGQTCRSMLDHASTMLPAVRIVKVVMST